MNDGIDTGRIIPVTGTARPTIHASRKLGIGNTQTAPHTPNPEAWLKPFARIETVSVQAPAQPAQPSQPVTLGKPIPDSAPQADLADRVIKMLLDGPKLIYAAACDYEQTDRKYKARLAELSIAALSAPLFTGKDGATRPASNDTERGLAIDRTVSTDAGLIKLAGDRDTTYHYFQSVKNEFEAAKLIAGLLTSSAGK